jgi:gamma-glutamylaminecyclotransferase
MSECIFVYGTLKRGLSNHRFLERQRFLGEARTKPAYRLVDCGGYPGMFAVEEKGVSVRGEVWEVDDDCRATLDVLEDVAHGMYALEPVMLLAPFDTDDVSTYVYRWPVEGKPEVKNEWTE